MDSEQIVGVLAAGLIGWVFFWLLARLKKPIKCPGCGFTLPKNEKPQNTNQVIWGGWTCPNCNSEMGRKGNVVNNDKNQNVVLEKLTDQAVLAEIAKTNVNCEIRLAAIEHLTGQAMIEEIAKTEKDNDLRQFAEKRLSVLRGE